MPTIVVSVPKGAWTKDEKSEIVKNLTETLNQVAVQSGKGDIKQYINAQVRETAEGGYAQGGQVIG